MKPWHSLRSLILLGLGLLLVPEAQGSEIPAQKRSLVIPVVLSPDSASAPASEPAAAAPALQCVASCGTALPISGVAFSPDGKMLAVGGYREVLLWNLAEAKLARRIGSGQIGTMVQAVLFDKAGRLLAVAEGTPDAAGAVRVFDLQTGQVVMDFQEPKDVVGCLALSPDGKHRRQQFAGHARPTCAGHERLADRCRAGLLHGIDSRRGAVENDQPGNCTREARGVSESRDGTQFPGRREDSRRESAIEG